MRVSQVIKDIDLLQCEMFWGFSFLLALPLSVLDGLGAV